MKISEYSPINKTSSVGKKKGVSSSSEAGGFMDLLSVGETENAAPTAPTSDIANVSSMDALLSLQEIPDNEIAKRKVLQESKDALETLEKLRVSLLSGKISGDILGQLGDVAELKKQAVNDPKLLSIIQDIELRAAVELAKLQVASRNN